MGKRRKGNCGNGFNNIFGSLKNFSMFSGGRRGPGGLSWFTPAKCCVCVAILLTLLLCGVGFYGLVIIGLLMVILVLLC